MKNIYGIIIFLLSGMILSSPLVQAQIMDDFGQVKRTQFTKTIEQASVSDNSLNSEWISLGPDGGDVVDICIDPLNTDRVFAAVGIPYVSEDKGENWTILNTLASMGTGKITTFEANTDGIILAGGLYNYGKLFRSTDEGQNWSTVYYPLSSAYVLDATVDPSNPNTFYLALSANGTSSKVLLKSTNAGENWSIIDLISVLPNGFSLVNIIIDPENDQNLYGIGNAGISDAMVIASFDGGASWEDITANLPANKPYNRLAIADGIVYLAGGQLFGGQHVGVYKTIDNGGSWQNISTTFPIKVSNFILIDPENHDILYVASEGDGVYYSNDAGGSWNFDGTGAGENGSARYLAFEPGNSQLIYGGFLSLAICKSTDAAQTWQYANEGIATLLLNDIEVNTTDPNKMLVGFEGENSGGCYLSNDGGLSWELVGSLPSTRYSQVAYGADGIMYAWSNGPTTVAAEGLYKSDDGGVSWENLGPHNGSAFETQIFALDVSKNNPDLLLIGGNNFGSFGWESMIYRSDDGGATWENTHQGPEFDSFKFLFIDQYTFDQNIYTAYKSDDQGGFLKSPDGGSNWLPISNGIPGSALWCGAITVDPNNSDILYGGVGGYGGLAGSIYRSENGGGTWEYANLTLGSNYSKVTDIMISPQNSKVIYVATTSSGGYMSSDSASSWDLMNENFPATNVTGFSNPFLKEEVWKLCTSTFTNSAYITDVFIPTAIGIFSNPHKSKFFKVFPNPSSGKFIIEMDNTLNETAEVIIFDKQGQTVYENSFDNKMGSNLNIDIDLSSGIWFLRISNDSQSYTEKIIIF